MQTRKILRNIEAARSSFSTKPKFDNRVQPQRQNNLTRSACGCVCGGAQSSPQRKSPEVGAERGAGAAAASASNSARRASTPPGAALCAAATAECSKPRRTRRLMEMVGGEAARRSRGRHPPPSTTESEGPARCVGASPKDNALMWGFYNSQSMLSRDGLGSMH